MADWGESEPAKVRRSAILHVRVPVRLKARIQQLRDHWTKKAKRENEDAREASEGDVVVRLMTNALEAVWKEAGLPAEPTDEQVEDLTRSPKSH